MRFSSFLVHLAISGLLVGLAYVVGVFTHFYFWGGQVYLLAAIVFLFPLLLNFQWLIISTSTAVVLVDFSTGWIIFTWISLLAYNAANIIIWICYKLIKFKIIYILATLAAAIVLALIYFSLETIIPTIGKAKAINDLISTSLELVISILIAWVLYFPVKTIGRILKIV